MKKAVLIHHIVIICLSIAVHSKMKEKKIHYSMYLFQVGVHNFFIFFTNSSTVYIENSLCKFKEKLLLQATYLLSLYTYAQNI